MFAVDTYVIGVVLVAIVGVAGAIYPIVAPLKEVALTLGVGMAALLLLLPNRGRQIGRGRGAWRLLLYAGFVWATLSV